ncbi:MAG: 4-deoxy-4-formamido-L-arabinose-phosphoundecaprenol deformylase [Desulfobacteraceae bacterium]|nr:4-deoxy-4-formamido-L-arabinose-phosphoundecaprenol deformylase [Desulfobacteraceae bacterium]
MHIGLRIDVDTFRGTKYGVPNLCRLLADHAVSASFFFSVGPDNMGRHLWRLIRPRFFLKMLRTKASSLYGWDILFRGTLWPGPVIGRKLGHIIRSVSDAGHEVGLHAWDHHGWQANIERMKSDAIFHSLNKGVVLLTRTLGRPPVSSAAPAWKCNDLVLLEKAKFPFSYNSDCRGEEIFYPLVRGEAVSQPQIPVTLPTYDEVIGRNHVTKSNYNDYLISLLQPEKLNVLTIHAEVEGVVCLEMFDRFLKMVHAIGAKIVPLGELLMDSQEIKHAAIVAREIPGREGWVSCQEAASSKVQI